MSQTHPCHVCGGPVGTFAHGFGTYSGPATDGKTVYLCHPNDESLPDCYTQFSRTSFWSSFLPDLGLDPAVVRQVKIVDERPK